MKKDSPHLRQFNILLDHDLVGVVKAMRSITGCSPAMAFTKWVSSEAAEVIGFGVRAGLIRTEELDAAMARENGHTDVRGFWRVQAAMLALMHQRCPSLISDLAAGRFDHLAPKTEPRFVDAFSEFEGKSAVENVGKPSDSCTGFNVRAWAQPGTTYEPKQAEPDASRTQEPTPATEAAQ